MKYAWLRALVFIFSMFCFWLGMALGEIRCERFCLSPRTLHEGERLERQVKDALHNWNYYRAILNKGRMQKLIDTEPRE